MTRELQKDKSAHPSNDRLHEVEHDQKASESESDYNNIEEPEDFYISMNYNDDLSIKMIEDATSLLDDLKNVQYDEKLAKFFANYKNDIEDLTE